MEPAASESSQENPPLLEARAPALPTLWLGGDILLSDALRDRADEGGDPVAGFAEVLEPVSRLWREDANAFVLLNLEVPVAARRRIAHDAAPEREGRLRAVHLHGPRWLPPALARAGVHGVSLANNHALDQTREGLEETIAFCQEAGLATLGAGVAPNVDWPLVFRSETESLAIINLYDGRRLPYAEDGEVGRAFVLPDGAERVRRLAEEHSYVVVTVHVLGELREEPRAEWRTWARSFAEAGADAIVVHGTHVIMPVEELHVGERSVPLIWGLGNFVSDMAWNARPGQRGTRKQERVEARSGLLARLRFQGGQVATDVLPLWMHDNRLPRWRSGNLEGAVRFAVLPMHGCVREEGELTSSELSVSDLPYPSGLPYVSGALGERVSEWIATERARIVSLVGGSFECVRSGPEPLWISVP